MNVTGPEKTASSYPHKMLLFVLWHLSPVLYVLHKSVSFSEFLMDFCICDYILDTILITDKSYYSLNSQN